MGKIYSPATPNHDGDFLLANSATLHEGVLVKNGSVIGGNVTVESNCQIIGSIIGSGAKIGGECKIIDSIIAPNLQIPAGTVVISNYLGF